MCSDIICFIICSDMCSATSILTIVLTSGLTMTSVPAFLSICAVACLACILTLALAFKS